MDTVLWVGLWLACGMITCIACIISDKKENGYSILSIIDVILVVGGPISLGLVCIIRLSKITIKI